MKECKVSEKNIKSRMKWTCFLKILRFAQSFWGRWSAFFARLPCVRPLFCGLDCGKSSIFVYYIQYTL